MASPRPIQLQRIAHAYYKYKDLEVATRFLVDFGFVEVSRSGDKVYFRGYGTEPWVLCASKTEADQADEFGGVAFAVESEEQLRRAADTLPGASAVYELKDAPGEGLCVTFPDPVDGFPFHLVYGQEEKQVLDLPLPKEPVNYPLEKNRPVNRTARFKKGPAPIHKLGHWGFCTTDFDKTLDFYTTHFNFLPSDIVHNAEGKDTTAFCRLNRGKEQVDHHVFFFFQGPKFHVHHTSYETHDFDVQVLGHDWLRERGWKNCWGVGRHVLGSQIFDYWFDPAGFIMEHYVDGDLANDEEPIHRTKESPGGLHVWGPDVPAVFLG